MKQEYVNAFLSPAQFVWQKELGCALSLTGAEAVANQFTTEDLTAIIGVSGSLQGNVLYGLDGPTALAVASTMVGEPVHHLDEISLSAIGEIANMITGNASTRLADEGYACYISTPVIIEPAGSRFTTVGGQAILVYFASALGTLKIRISLHETANRM